MTKTIRTPTDSEILQKTVKVIPGNTQATKKTTPENNNKNKTTTKEPQTKKAKQKQTANTLRSYLEKQKTITFEEFNMSLFC